MTDRGIHLTFWEHIDELRVTVIKILLVISLGTAISLLFYPQIFQILTYPHQQLSRSKDSHASFVVENLDRTRIRKVSEGESIYNLPSHANTVSVSSEHVKKISNTSYLIPQGEYIDYDKVQPVSQLILLSPAEGLTTILKTSIWVGFVGTSPFWLYFILQFIAPALRSREKKFFFPFLAASLLFLAFGFAFAFYVTIPLANRYLLEINQTLGLNFWSLSQYLSYSILLLFANGLAFETSVILFFLVHYGWISAEGMRRKRKNRYREYFHRKCHPHSSRCPHTTSACHSSHSYLRSNCPLCTTFKKKSEI